MTVLNIYKLEDVNQTKAVSSLRNGEHHIGRDGILNCTDKRVSRHHAILIITDEAVTLKSLHVNPCFYKAARGNCIVLLKKDESVNLNDGDRFALLADSYWFKVRLSSEGVNSESTKTQILQEFEKVCKANTTEESEVTEAPNSCLRNVSLLLNTSLHAEEAKINPSLLLSNLENIVEQDFGTNTENIAAEDKSNDSMDFSELLTRKTEETDSALAKESAKGENGSEAVGQSRKEVDYSDAGEESEKASGKIEKPSIVEDVDTTKTHGDSDDESTNHEEPSVSTDKPKVRRDRCWYGANCYRKNPAHRAAISHPGDDDYDSDPADDRPLCPFGSACYRTNVDHRRVYKHSAPPSIRKPAPPKQPPQKKSESSSDSEHSNKDDDKDTGKRKKRKAAQKVKFNETPEDDYDYDDPFLNDASSDDFELSEDDDGDDTTDWEDSQAMDEESHERKRLLKEAKKFTKGKKKRKT
nr:aprataxin and PNK-like factor [Leptinotarsa decemlineata]